MSEELHKLAVEKGEAEDALYHFGYINVFDLSPEERAEVAKRRADLEAACAVARGRYRAHLAKLETEASEATS
jgi:hypothetical protein